MRQGYDRSSGFTLLELLVALALIGLLTASMAAGLDFGVRSWRHARHSSETTARRVAVRNALAGLFESTRPDYVSLKRFDRRLYFEGYPDHVSFLGALPEAVAHDIVARETLGLTGPPGTEDKVLALSWALDLPGSSQQPAPSTTVGIMDHVSGMTLRYWGRLPADEADAWHDSWVDEASLPKLIHLELTSISGPPLLLDARILATAAVSCVYDLVSAGCNRQQ